MPVSRLVVSIPTASSDGRFYGRYPLGNAPSGGAADLAAAANDTSTASGALATGIRLSGAAADAVSATAALTAGAGSQTLSILFPKTMPPAGQGIAYQQSFDAIGAGISPPLLWSMNGPAWATMDSDGTFHGTPSAGDLGANVFSITVTDALGNYGAGSFTCSVF